MHYSLKDQKYTYDNWLDIKAVYIIFQENPVMSVQSSRNHYYSVKDLIYMTFKLERQLPFKSIVLPNEDLMVISSETKASDLPTLFSAYILNV